MEPGAKMPSVQSQVWVNVTVISEQVNLEVGSEGREKRRCVSVEGGSSRHTGLPRRKGGVSHGSRRSSDVRGEGRRGIEGHRSGLHGTRGKSDKGMARPWTGLKGIQAGYGRALEARGGLGAHGLGNEKGGWFWQRSSGKRCGGLSAAD